MTYDELASAGKSTLLGCASSVASSLVFFCYLLWEIGVLSSFCLFFDSSSSISDSFPLSFPNVLSSWSLLLGFKSFLSWFRSCLCRFKSPLFLSTSVFRFSPEIADYFSWAGAKNVEKLPWPQHAVTSGHLQSVAATRLICSHSRLDSFFENRFPYFLRVQWNAWNPIQSRIHQGIHTLVHRPAVWRLRAANFAASPKGTETAVACAARCRAFHGACHGACPAWSMSLCRIHVDIVDWRRLIKPKQPKHVLTQFAVGCKSQGLWFASISSNECAKQILHGFNFLQLSSDLFSSLCLLGNPLKPPKSFAEVQSEACHKRGVFTCSNSKGLCHYVCRSGQASLLKIPGIKLSM